MRGAVVRRTLTRLRRRLGRIPARLSEVLRGPDILPLSRVRSIRDLDPNPLKYERLAFMEHIGRYDREELREHYRRQPLGEVYANYVVNLWEYEHGVETLTSRPWNITIPMTEVCNAVCTFCSAPLVPAPKALAVGEIAHFAEALRHAVRVSLQGLGEPLAHPQFEAVVEEIRRHLNPVAEMEMITNGWLLSGRRWELLKAIRIAHLQVSVNAATDATHQIAMGSRPGTFDQVVRNIETVMADPGWAQQLLKVSMVITRHSLPEVVPFLDMFVDLGVENFQFNALLPLTTSQWGFGREGQYVDLWSGNLPNARDLVEKARAAIDEYRRLGIHITATPEQWLGPVELGLPLRVDGRPHLLLPHEGMAELLGSEAEGARFRGTSTARRWAYLFRSSSFRAAPGRYALEMEATVESGRLFVGILDLEKDDFIVQRGLYSGRTALEFVLPEVRFIAIIVRQGDDERRVLAHHRRAALRCVSDGASLAAAAPPKPVTPPPAFPPAAPVRDPLPDAPGAPSAADRIYCPMVYNTLSVFHHSLDVSMCCYMENAPGHRQPKLDEAPLLDMVNDPAFRLVRRTLMTDKHLPACDACPYGNFRSY